MYVSRVRNVFLISSVCFFLVLLEPVHATSGQKHKDRSAVSDGTPVKKVLRKDAPSHAGENLLDPNAWRPWHKGFNDGRVSLFVTTHPTPRSSGVFHRRLF